MKKKSDTKKKATPKKKVKSRSFKLWVTVEEHIIYEDGSDEYKDVPDTTASVGEFEDEKDAIMHMENLSEWAIQDGNTL